MCVCDRHDTLHSTGIEFICGYVFFFVSSAIGISNGNAKCIAYFIWSAGFHFEARVHKIVFILAVSNALISFAIEKNVDWLTRGEMAISWYLAMDSRNSFSSCWNWNHLWFMLNCCASAVFFRLHTKQLIFEHSSRELNEFDTPLNRTWMT